VVNLADTSPGCVERTTPICRAELEAVGIPVVEQDPLAHAEVRSAVRGELHGWTFTRHWYYWAARGPKIAVSLARDLWQECGQQVRWGGDCACREPEEDGYPGADSVHIDTQGGLHRFADFLRAIANDEEAWLLFREMLRANPVDFGDGPVLEEEEVTRD
jgi:hypothetical protein